MSAIREGRTAIVTVSDGWVLFGPDQSLMKQRTGASGAPSDPMPGTPPPVGVGPGGSLTTRPNKDMYSDDRTECDKDRTALALADNERYFRDILEEARRANVSFYTVDPRGLSTADDPGGLDPPTPAALDRKNLTSRSDSLITLAHNTDGLALVNNNDLRGQLRRAADDLTSYYLMGYYSTNGKLDGRYRSIRVRSKATRTIVPVTVGERTDPASGQRWLTADVTLAPLGPGDYVVELTTPKGAAPHHTLIAFRVTP